MDQRGKKLLLIASVVILLVLGVAAYFIFFNKTTTTNTTGVNPDLFPFNQQTNQLQDLPLVTDGETTTNPGGFDTTVAPEPAPRDRLRKITTFPISGFVSFLTPDTITETVLDEKTGLEKQINRPITIHRIRYNDQRNGHLFEGIINDDSIVNRQITKTDLPSAEELILNSTGTVGILRYEKNNSIESFQIQLPVINAELPSYCKLDFKTDLKAGVKNKSEVKKLQQYIRDKFSTKIALDGVYGKQATAGVKQIQAQLGLTESGIFDEPTRQAIAADCSKIQNEISATQQEPYELKGLPIAGYITQAVKNNADNTLFLLKTEGKKTTGLLKPISSTETKQIFKSSFNEWLPQFVNKSLITLTTYASGSVGGYMYSLDVSNQKFSKTLGPLNGLTTLTSPDGKHALVSITENGQLVLKIINLETRSEKILPFSTLSEKCVWYLNDQIFCGVPTVLPAGIYPDDWYKGIISFSDTLWSYSLSTDRGISIITPKESVDMFRVESYISSEYLFFMNKNDYTLWSYRIGGQD